MSESNIPEVQFAGADFRPTNVRWKIFGVIVALVVVNFIDRTALSIAMPSINKSFMLSPAMSGIILSSFFWAYGIAQLPAGWFIDRFGPRKVVSFSTFFWGVFQTAAAIATGGIFLILTRIGLGFAESPMFPSGAKLNAIWLAKTERGRGAVIVDCGAPLGAAIGGFLMAWLIIHLNSWRIAFFVVGLITVICSFVAWYYLRDNPANHPAVNAKELLHIQNSKITDKISEKIQSSTDKLQILSRSFIAILVGRFGWAMVNFGLLTWGPSYLEQSRGFNLKQMGFTTFAIFFAGMGGSLVGGFGADFLISRGLKRAFVYKTMLCISGAVCVIGFLLLPHVVNPGIAVLMLSIVLFFLYWGSLYWSLPPIFAPKSKVGQLGSAMNFVGSIGGILVPILVGLILQKTKTYFYVLEFFAACAAMYAVANLVIDFRKEQN